MRDPSQVKRYTERLKTAHEHAWEINAARVGRRFRVFGRKRVGGGC